MSPVKDKNSTSVNNSADKPSVDSTADALSSVNISEKTTSNDDKQVDANTNTTKDDNATPTKNAKLQALREKSQKAKENKEAKAAKNIELFDTTKADQWGITSTRSSGIVPKSEGSITISGRNIGAEEREPKWNNEQLEVIRQANSTVLQIGSVTDTRRCVMDPDQYYVMVDDKGSLVPTENAYVSSLSPDEYVIATGSPRFYTDVVLAGNNGQWLVNQWTSEGVVIEGVSSNVLSQNNRVGNTSGRRIGHHFARIGLPAYAFGPVFKTLENSFPGCTNQMAKTTGYMWVNASWGVSSFPGTYVYLDADRNAQRVTSLLDVMRMLNGKSSLCLGTIAISLTNKPKMEGGKYVPDTSTYGLSIKIHNAFQIDTVDYHGPPQQGSTGMSIPIRIAAKAKVMDRTAGTITGGGVNMFGGANKSIFAHVNAPPPSVKSSNANSYMA